VSSGPAFFWFSTAASVESQDEWEADVSAEPAGGGSGGFSRACLRRQ
jgi:hypothetical protein